MKLRPRIITMDPATISTMREAPLRDAPTLLKTTPNVVKTIENPAMKNRVLMSIPHFDVFLSASSSQETPPINDKQEGITGKIQGEMNDMKHAIQANRHPYNWHNVSHLRSENMEANGRVCKFKKKFFE